MLERRAFALRGESIVGVCGLLWRVLIEADGTPSSLTRMLGIMVQLVDARWLQCDAWVKRFLYDKVCGIATNFPVAYFGGERSVMVRC